MYKGTSIAALSGIDANGRKSDQCRGNCPAGAICSLSKDVKHEWHVCKDAICSCHGERRYQYERQKETSRVS